MVEHQIQDQLIENITIFEKAVFIKVTINEPISLQRECLLIARLVILVLYVCACIPIV